ncbi:MAG: ATP-binding protein [Vicinamibacterales bacterium]|nr:ATP-binding protein [Vicinamibacterales bacterium]
MKVAGVFRSLKARLTGLVVTVVVAAWAGATWFTYREARHEIDELLDAHLAQSVALLVAQAGEEIEEFDTEHVELGRSISNAVAFQVWEHGRRLALHSANAPDTPLGGPDTGFSERDVEGRRWRVFSAWDREHENLVHVGERVEARAEIAQEMLEAALAPLLLAAPLLGILVWLAVRSGVRPLDRVADEVGRREPGRLDPLDTTDVPTELKPLLHRINSLFGEVTRSIEHERRFTADAAHELRTPLAAIRAQAQVALGVTDPVEREVVLRKVMAACDRTARLMEQLLTLARLDAVPAALPEQVDLRRLAAAAIAEAAPAAASRRIDVSLDGDAPAGLVGHPALLQVLLRNLVDNAIRYTPDGGQVQVRVVRAASGVDLAVLDTGDGIPEAERERVLERFYRVTGARADGSGLGLSIVARVAAVHGATVALDEGLCGVGTGVRVTFPDGALSVTSRRQPAAG